MSPVFGIVSEYTKTDVFSDLIKGSNPEKAIKFVEDKIEYIHQEPGFEGGMKIAELAAIYRRNFLFSAATPPYITLKCENKEKDIEQFMGNLANLMDKSKKV